MSSNSSVTHVLDSYTPWFPCAFAFPALLNEFGVCGSRSKNEKTHKGCELRQVLVCCLRWDFLRKYRKPGWRDETCHLTYVQTHRDFSPSLPATSIGI